MKNLVSTLVDNRLVQTNAPAGVKVILNRKNDRHILHLVNQHIASAYGMSDGANNLTLRGLTVSIDARRIGSPKRIYTVPGGQDLTFRMVEEDRVEIEIGDFDVSTIIAIE